MKEETIRLIKNKARELGLNQVQIEATFRAHNGGVLTAEAVRAGQIRFSSEKHVNADLLEFMDELTCECVPPWAAYSSRPPEITNPMRRLHLGLDGPGALLKQIVKAANEGAPHA